MPPVLSVCVGDGVDQFSLFAVMNILPSESRQYTFGGVIELGNGKGKW